MNSNPSSFPNEKPRSLAVILTLFSTFYHFYLFWLFEIHQLIEIAKFYGIKSFLYYSMSEIFYSKTRFPVKIQWGNSSYFIMMCVELFIILIMEACDIL